MKVVTFGEIMLRLSPPGNERFLQARSFDAHFGGAEANVAVALAQWGVSSAFVSAVPDNDLGQACLNTLRGWGVETAFVQRGAGRLGIYFLEHGASQRPSNVIYDRAESAISQLDPASLDWDAIFEGATWFHFSGITPALSESARTAVAEAARTAKERGLTVSCDLNYRKKLWTREQARAAMTELMEHVDVCIANEEDAASVFGIEAQGSDPEAGTLDAPQYEEVARQLVERFGLKAAAITLRLSHSASRNGWSGVVFTDGAATFGRWYVIDVVDRVGSGDSFAAGLIFGFLQGMDPREAVEFAAAAGCLAHSVPGDFGVFSREEVESLVKGGGSGRVRR
ncbi:MAG: sugar kinase [Fimbriimonadaceae bacterium]|nr:sugar kinase [Fimbriimonadaceae bacterium]